MKKIGFILSALMLVILSACGSKAEKANEKEEDVVVVPISVELTVPEKAEVDEAISLETVVKQGDDFVDDASEVVYEVWEEGKKEESFKIESTHKGDGQYIADTSFDHDGQFHVQVHVTARDMHTMPEKIVTVGEGNLNTGAVEHEGEDHGHDHGHADGFSMHFMEPENPTMGTSVDLVTHLQMDGVALEKAEVRYEIWKATEEKHEWVNAKEVKVGEYQAAFTFKESAAYTVQIHVENEQGLHEHEHYEIDVK